MDNQQAIGKLAGLYLGEGHFSVSKWQRDNGAWQFNAEVGFSNTDASLIHFVCDWLDEIQAKFHMSQNNSNCWQVKVQRHGDILKVIDALEPHLFGQKKAEAAIVRRFVTRRIELSNKSRSGKTKGGVMSPYTEDDHALVDEKRTLSASPQRLMSTARQSATA